MSGLIWTGIGEFGDLLPPSAQIGKLTVIILRTYTVQPSPFVGDSIRIGRVKDGEFLVLAHLREPTGDIGRPASMMFVLGLIAMSAHSCRHRMDGARGLTGGHPVAPIDLKGR